MEYELNPFKLSGLLLWKDYVLPYGIVNFVLLPFLFMVSLLLKIEEVGFTAKEAIIS